LAQALGENTLAYSIILGVRIVSVQIDPEGPEGTSLEFVAGGQEETQRALLPDFCDALLEAMLEDEEFPTHLPDEPTALQLRQFIGVKQAMICGLIGVRLDQLFLDANGSWCLEVAVGESEDTVPLDVLRDILMQRVRNEGLQPPGTDGGKIDLEVIPGVLKAAEEEDWDTVIRTVGPWVRGLSMFTRTLDFQRLDPESRILIGKAMVALGRAFGAQAQGETADEVFRVACQFAQDTSYAPDVFLELGSLYESDGREGQAIGLLKRAIALGARQSEALPLLSRCFVARERFVPALVCADEAVAAGASEDAVKESRSAALEVLGQWWGEFRQHVPAGRPDAPTIVPPEAP